MLHALTEVSLDDFVAAVLVHDNTGAPIESYAFHADDGAIQNESGWDTMRDTECAIYSDDPRCTPLEIALHYDDLWADPTCVGAHAAVDLDRIRPCGRPTAVLDYTATGALTFFEIGAALPMAYRGTAGSCAPAQALAGDVFYVVGAPIVDAQFPVASTVEDGTGRLRARRYQQATGAPLGLAWGFFDTTFNETCTPQPFSDGTTRCVPASAQMGGGLYADSKCMTPIAGLNVAHVAAILVADPNHSCGANFRYESFAVGAPFAGPIFGGGMGCTPYSRDPSVTYVSFGDSIDLAQLDER